LSDKFLRLADRARNERFLLDDYLASLKEVVGSLFAVKIISVFEQGINVLESIESPDKRFKPFPQSRHRSDWFWEFP
jgi:hypothetical protein